MSYNWNLEILYRGLEDPVFEADLARLDELTAALNSLAGEADGLADAELVKRYLALSEEHALVSGKLCGYCMLRYSVNTGDSAISGMTGRLMGKLSESTAAETALQNRIAGMQTLDVLIDGDDAVRPYRYLLTNIRRDNKYRLSEKEEALFATMNISGAAAWEDLQSSLTSTVKASWRGQELTLSAVRNLAYDADASVRRDAYEAELGCYGKIQDSVAFALNSIKLQVLNECRLRGYASPLEKSLLSSRMKRETLDALMGAIEEYLPVFWKYLRAKAEALGYENGLPWFELFAPMGKNDRRFTAEEARDYLLNIFRSFDGQLHDMVARAFAENWIDFFPAEGKVGGAFDYGVPSAGQSRVLTNFDGSFSDVVTLAHELGHAFHDQQVFSHPLLNQEYSMPVAETASTFNEVVVVSEAIRRSTSDAERLSLMESQISDACQIICDIYSRYLFESAVFERRAEEFLDADTLCAIMLDAQKKAYGDGLDPAYLHPYMWLCKGHYYSGSLSFYNFPYAFGGLLARGLYARYQQEGARFVPLYKEMLHATSVCDVEDCARIAGVDLTSRAFWESGLQSLAEEIEQLCGMLKK